MLKKSKIKSFASENVKSTGDNACSREQTNSSINSNSNSNANDAEYLKELEQVIKDRAAE
ncbi:hypothetical protein SOV_51580 [Sporomusa ovata DSM 2662]|uniref:Uncharacterized protein n=1 Tax=Sporomusa ovata TaxID=2378 RepID=A0A0U1L122_9FIRM|nr:hypothetical protein [Sporomusa ovata]EQB27531.1 hypothetical protein SOV_2c04270 [Sporomusa ovata DSM 2662]CQR73377.1 hypothetical protein SpAn4DRAFT_2609 [Sporomusa ovata]